MKSQGEIGKRGNPQPTFFHSTSAHFRLLIRSSNVSKLPFCLPIQKQTFGSKARPRKSPALFQRMRAGPRIVRDSQGERAPGLPSRHDALPVGFLPARKSVGSR
jgi:hypothetical protein